LQLANFNSHLMNHKGPLIPPGRSLGNYPEPKNVDAYALD